MYGKNGQTIVPQTSATTIETLTKALLKIYEKKITKLIL